MPNKPRAKSDREVATDHDWQTALGVLAMFSPETPMIVSPAIYRGMVRVGLPTENVVVKKRLPVKERTVMIPAPCTKEARDEGCTCLYAPTYWPSPGRMVTDVSEPVVDPRCPLHGRHDPDAECASGQIQGR